MKFGEWVSNSELINNPGTNFEEEIQKERFAKL
jgi:hypothetical protein